MGSKPQKRNGYGLAMSPDAAAVFAQVIPVLIVATYLSNIGYREIPMIIRAFMFYFFIYAVVAEGGLLYFIAYGEPVTAVFRAMAFSSALLLLGFLVLILAFRLGTNKVSADGSSDNRKDQE